MTDEDAWIAIILQMQLKQLQRWVSENIGDPDEQTAAFDAIWADVVKRMQLGE